MASLTLSVGPLSVSLTASDAAATELLNNYLSTLEDVAPDATNQEKAQAVLRSLAQYMRQRAQQGVDLDENTEARTRAAARIAALQDWSE